jgi:hypothetical protein
MGNIGSAARAKEEDLMDLLDIIILKMMLVEKIEGFQIKNHYNRQLIKNVLKRALDVIVPTAERDHAILFKAGEEDTQQVTREYEKLIAFIRDFNVPQKVMLTQMIEAFNYEKDTMEATTHRIIKKHSKKS